MPTPRRVVRADLKRSLPKGMSPPKKLALLRERTALAGSLRPNKPRKPRQVGAIGAGPFHLAKIRTLESFKVGSVNYDVARKLADTFHASQSGRLEPTASEQQALVNLVNNVLRAQKRGRRVKFFGAQEKVLEKYSQM